MAQKFQYPALYVSADKSSNRVQKQYLRSVAGEYALLISAATIALSGLNRYDEVALYAFVVIISSALLLFRFFTKPEQAWYKCRALAESIKTTSWRYMMRATPFEESPQVPRAEFHSFLRDILMSNKEVGEYLIGDPEIDHQITGSMDEVRALGLRDRLAVYIRHRIREQQAWYRKKARYNRIQRVLWMWLTLGAYLGTLALLFFKLRKPEQQYLPFEPLLVLASAFIGWTQIKKFSELAASYSLTAFEIGIIADRSPEIETEDQLSDFVNEAERAFSREHTQWIARYQAD